MDSAGNGRYKRQNARRAAPGLGEAAQVLAFDALHRKPLHMLAGGLTFACGIDAGDVRVFQRRQGGNLALEASLRVGRQRQRLEHLQRHIPIWVVLARQVHAAHGPLAEHPLNLVRPDAFGPVLLTHLPPRAGVLARWCCQLVSRIKASRYFATVFEMTVSGNRGPGAVLSQSSVSR